MCICALLGAAFWQEMPCIPCSCRRNLDVESKFFEHAGYADERDVAIYDLPHGRPQCIVECCDNNDGQLLSFAAVRCNLW